MAKVLHQSRPLKRVVLLVALQHGGSRGQVRGIYRYVQPNKPWALRTRLPDLTSVEIAATWKPDGIIVQATTPAMVERLKRLDVPVVNLSGRVAGQPFPQVLIDHRAMGRVAAEYLLAKGFRNFGYLEDVGSEASEHRLEGFGETLAKAGCVPSTVDIREDEGVYAHWELAQNPLAQWLMALPKPVAILGDDYRALVAAETCLSIRLPVPEQAALLGMDNDDLVCSLGRPPLSSIQGAFDQIGYEAARLLDHLMAGKEPPDQPIRIPPVGVVTRASTDIMAIDDAEVAAAMRFINEYAAERISVQSIVDALPTGRRVLERRFRKALGRTMLEEIHRVKVERAKMVLLTSSKPIPKVAEEMGFRDSYHFWSVFHNLTGMAPADYRKKHRA